MLCSTGEVRPRLSWRRSDHSRCAALRRQAAPPALVQHGATRCTVGAALRRIAVHFGATCRPALRLVVTGCNRLQPALQHTRLLHDTTVSCIFVSRVMCATCPRARKQGDSSIRKSCSMAVTCGRSMWSLHMAVTWPLHGRCSRCMAVRGAACSHLNAHGAASGS